MGVKLDEKTMKGLIEEDYFLVILNDKDRMVGKISLKELLEYIKNGSY